MGSTATPATTGDSNRPRSTKQGSSENPFKDTDTSVPGRGSQDDAGQAGGDTTPASSAEPAPSDEETPSSEDTAQPEPDTTGDDGPEPSDETEEPSRDAEGDESEHGDEAPEDEEPTEHPFQYIGVDEEELPEDHQDYLFVSGEDPDQRYEDLDSFIDGYENLINYKGRIETENEDLRSRLTETKQKRAQETEELKARVSLYEDELGEDELVDVLAKRYMPEEFEGLSKDDFTDQDKRDEFVEARALARQKAERDLDEREQTIEEQREAQAERQERIESVVSEAEETVRGIDGQTLGLAQEEVEPVLGSVAEDVLGESDPSELFGLLYDAKVLPRLAAEAYDEEEIRAFSGAEKTDEMVELMLDGIRHRAQQEKGRQMEERSERIRTETTRRENGTPKTADEEPETVPAGKDPRKIFRTGLD